MEWDGRQLFDKPNYVIYWPIHNYLVNNLYVKWFYTLELAFQGPVALTRKMTATGLNATEKNRTTSCGCTMSWIFPVASCPHFGIFRKPIQNRLQLVATGLCIYKWFKLFNNYLKLCIENREGIREKEWSLIYIGTFGRVCNHVSKRATCLFVYKQPGVVREQQG